MEFDIYFLSKRGPIGRLQSFANLGQSGPTFLLPEYEVEEGAVEAGFQNLWPEEAPLLEGTALSNLP